MLTAIEKQLDHVLSEIHFEDRNETSIKAGTQVFIQEHNWYKTTSCSCKGTRRS